MTFTAIVLGLLGYLTIAGGGFVGQVLATTAASTSMRNALADMMR